MGAFALGRGAAMATRWRRRQMCTLGRAPATIRTVSASQVFVETNARPPLGEAVPLAHPEAGTITGRIGAHHGDGVTLVLDGSAKAVAFALAAIASDMTRPH